MSTYKELLTDPRWQQKRLHVMDAAGWKCQSCYGDKKTLHVHHKKYRSGAKPWEYDDGELICLCVDCHDLQHQDRARLNDSIERYKSEGWHTDVLAGLMDAFTSMERGKEFPASVPSYEYAEGWAIYLLAFRTDRDNRWRAVNTLTDEIIGRVSS